MDNTFDRSFQQVSFDRSYDQYGRPTAIAPQIQATQDNGDLTRYSEFTSQADFDNAVGTLRAAIDTLTDRAPLTAQQQQLGAILNQTDTWDPDFQKSRASKRP